MTAPRTAISTYPRHAELLPTEELGDSRYTLRFARSLEELDEVLRLRFQVFNVELSEGLEESWETGRDVDPFDEACHHLIVVERDSDEIVGTYRLQTSAMAGAHRGFYSDGEFDLSALPPAVLDDAVELGRACVAREHRNTQVLFLLWKGLALYVASNRLNYLFGCCSLTSQDPAEGRAVMAHLEERELLHPELRVQPQPGLACYPEGTAVDPAVTVHVPTLFRIYLRHGAKICGPPAIDREFKTIDFFVIFDVSAMDERQFRKFFGRHAWSR